MCVSLHILYRRPKKKNSKGRKKFWLLDFTYFVVHELRNRKELSSEEKDCVVSFLFRNVKSGSFAMPF